MGSRIIATVDSLFDYATRNRGAIVALIQEMVECESPSDDPAAVRRFADLVASRLAPMASTLITPAGHLVAELNLPGRRKQGRVLVLGHSDTVWPLGTLKSMPFRQERGRLWGPGVLDMKSGIAFFLFAAQALRELEIGVPSRVLLQLNADEEVGSPSSRALTEKNARACKAVLVLEPGTGLEGRLKTARKGTGCYTLRVRGVASHAGVDFAAGASAILELARQLVRISSLTDPGRGITVNPGVISGGTRPNVVAAQASAEVDIRIARLSQAAALDRKFRALKPFDHRCSLDISGGLNRPPMERSQTIVRLFRQAQEVGRCLGIQLEESSTGGGSDGNFTAALGVPTLDGLGGVGEGAHAITESILIERIADRVALLAGLLARI